MHLNRWYPVTLAAAVVSSAAAYPKWTASHQVYNAKGMKIRKSSNKEHAANKNIINSKYTYKQTGSFFGSAERDTAVGPAPRRARRSKHQEIYAGASHKCPAPTARCVLHREMGHWQGPLFLLCSIQCV